MVTLPNKDEEQQFVINDEDFDDLEAESHPLSQHQQHSNPSSNTQQQEQQHSHEPLVPITPPQNTTNSAHVLPLTSFSSNTHQPSSSAAAASASTSQSHVLGSPIHELSPFTTTTNNRRPSSSNQKEIEHHEIAIHPLNPETSDSFNSTIIADSSPIPGAGINNQYPVQDEDDEIDGLGNDEKAFIKKTSMSATTNIIPVDDIDLEDSTAGMDLGRDHRRGLHNKYDDKLKEGESSGSSIGSSSQRNGNYSAAEYDSDADHDHDLKSNGKRRRRRRRNLRHSSKNSKKSKHVVVDFSKPLVDAPIKTPRWPLVLIGFIGLALFGYLLAQLMVGSTRYGHILKVNVIIMITSFGPSSQSFAREYVQYLHDTNHTLAQPGGRWQFPETFKTKNDDDQDEYSKVAAAAASSKSSDPNLLPLDPLFLGQLSTRSANSLITDQAAAGTAFSCASKTYNGAVGVSPSQDASSSSPLLPCGTILESAHSKRFYTGLLSSSRLTGSIPASFYAHVQDHNMQDRISQMLVGNHDYHPLGRQIDFAAGGGLCTLLPNSNSDSCRNDSQNLQDWALSNGGWKNIITERSEWDNLGENRDSMNTMSLFSLDQMSSDIDRSQVGQPSLSEMSDKTIKIMSAAAQGSSAPGFLLVIDDSSPGLSAQARDPVSHLNDILAYQETVSNIKKFVADQDKLGWPTIFLSLSPYEVGGPSLGLVDDDDINDTGQNISWSPQVLTRATSSSRATATTITQNITDSTPPGELGQHITSIITDRMGIDDLSRQELDSLIEAQPDVAQLETLISTMVSNRAGITWSPVQRSAADTNLYALGHATQNLAGFHDNVDVGLFLSNVMELNRDEVTKDLNKHLDSWGYQ